MPLAHRVIPTILCNGRKLVKGKQFNAWRTVGLASQAVRIHAARGVDEVCLLDIGATPEGRGPDLALVEELSEVLFTPFTVGGGIRSLADVKALLRAGADNVVLGTMAFAKVPNVVKEIADTVGRQALVVAVDVRKGKVFTHSGRHSTGMDPAEYAGLMEAEGAGEILLTSIDREGTMRGYDLDLIRSVRDAVTCPLIAHGGCGTYQHMVEAIEAGANAVAAGAMFQFSDLTPKGAAEYLHEHGIEARV